jgi:hypothetical protein
MFASIKPEATRRALPVMPAKAGIQQPYRLDSRLRGNDKLVNGDWISEGAADGALRRKTPCPD